MAFATWTIIVNDMAPAVLPEEMILDKAQLLALAAPEWGTLIEVSGQ